MPIDFPTARYADPSVYADAPPTDDDRVMLRTAAGTDAKAALIQPKGYIDGLRMEYVSPSQIRVTSGSAYVPGAKRIAELAAAVTLSLTLTPNTWYHLYLTVVGAVVGVEAVTTAPAAPYYGTARAKTGDTSRRYIGSVRTDAAGSIYNFLIQAAQQLYMQEVPRSISGGGTTSFALASLAALVPVTSRAALVSMTNTGSGAVRFRPAGSTFTGMNRMYGLTPGSYVVGILPTDSSQNIEFQSEPGGIGNLDVVGFVVER